MKIHWPAGARRVELFVAVSTTLYGLWLLAPWWDSFGTTAAIYAWMAHYAPEPFWGALFALAGGLLLVGSWRRNRPLRIAGAFAVFWCRGFLAVLSGITNHWSTGGVPDFLMWAAMAGVSLIGAWHNEP